MMLQDSRGAFLPIFAVIAVAILAIVIGLSIDASIVKIAGLNLRIRADDICKVTAEAPTLIHNAVTNFSSQVNYLISQGAVNISQHAAQDIVITGAKLIVPTMPGNGLFAFFDPDNPLSLPAPSFVGETTFAALGFPSCNVPGTDCIFEGRVSDPGGYDTEYPGSTGTNVGKFWNNLQHAGNTVACELRATVTTYISGDKDILARTVWRRKLRGQFQQYDWSQARSTAPGLTIGIATELTTNAGDPRFRFHQGILATIPATVGVSYGYDTPGNPLFPGGGPANLRDLFDPLFDFDQAARPTDAGNIAPGNGRTAFHFRARSRPFPEPAVTNNLLWPFSVPSNDPATTVAEMPAGLLSHLQSGVASWNGVTYVWPQPAPPPLRSINFNRQVTGGADPYQSWPPCQDPVNGLMGIPPNPNDPSCLVLSDREEMLAACMNPLILVRNTFISTIVELASRHGQLRNMTEILHVNPAHRNVANPGDIPPVFNHPSLITSFGEDITQQAFHMPFVAYYTGDAAGGAGVFGVTRPGMPWTDKKGWINPFESAFVPATAWKHPVDGRLTSHHALVASQLRMCYHLYQDDPVFQPNEFGIDRFDGPNYHGAPGGPCLGDELCPFEPGAAYTFFNRLRGDRVSVDDSYWDQLCPWQSDPALCSPDLPLGAGSTLLTAGEVVASLGSAQTCPIFHAGLPNAASGGEDIFPDNALTAAKNETGICEKPPLDPGAGNLSFDLRPDILGFLIYAAKRDAADSNTYRNFKALNSPGIFPISNQASPASIETYGNASRYSVARNTTSAILIITHHPLSVPERDAMRNEVLTNPNLVNRPITLIYFPWTGTNKNDLIAEIDNFELALGATPGFPDGRAPENPWFSSSSASENRVFVFSPYLAKYFPTGPADDPEGKSATLRGAVSERFRNYWLYLLSDTRENVVVSAENIFFQRILSLENQL